MNKIKTIRACSKYLIIASAVIIVFTLTLGDDFKLSDSVLAVLFLIAVFLAFTSIILFIISLILSARSKAPDKVSGKDYRERLAHYNNLPYCEIEDYNAELNLIRENYAKGDFANNRFDVPNFWFYKPLKDFKVFESGKIYYGSLVQANEALFENTKLERVLPAVIVYSTEEYYENNPEELEEIARKLFADKENNVLKNETEYKYHLPVDESLTGGRKVCMSTLLINSRQFPLNYVSGSLFPVIVNPEKSSSVFVVDCRYWTDKFMGNFLHANNLKKRLEEYAKKFADIGYSEIESYRNERDFIWDRLIEENAVENLCERGNEELFDGLDGKQNLKVCYGAVIAADKDWQSKANVKRLFMPVLIVYGTDSEYINNPLLLAADAQKWLSTVNTRELLENFKEKPTAICLPPECTDGRRAYATSIAVSRLWVPDGKLTGNILPVVADSNAPENVNFIPVHYWSDRFIGNFKGNKDKNNSA